MAVIWVTRVGGRTQNQAIFVGDYHLTIDTKLLGLFGFTLADTLDLRRL